MTEHVEPFWFTDVIPYLRALVTFRLGVTAARVCRAPEQLALNSAASTMGGFPCILDVPLGVA
jgi:hypothetical protein